MEALEPKEHLMTAARFFLVILIFVAAGCAWLVLGGTIDYRTATLDKSAEQEVNARWGPSGLVQQAPILETNGLTSRSSADIADPVGSDIKVQLEHEDRYMGLVWFSVYTVRFSGDYAVQAPMAKDGSCQFVFQLPEKIRSFEDLTLKVDGKESSGVAAGNSEGMLRIAVPTDGQKHAVSVSYLRGAGTGGSTPRPRPTCRGCRSSRTSRWRPR